MSSGKTSKETAKVELSFMCTKLADLDKFSKSDPFLILSAITVRQAGGEEPPQRLGQTEVIYDDLNPKFQTTFMVDYCFQELQQFKVDVYDCDNNKHIEDVSKHDYIGSARFTMAEALTGGKMLCKSLRNGDKICGNVHINAEEVEESKCNVHMQMYAINLDKKDFLGKSDPFVEISKAQEGGEDAFTVIYRSQHIKKTLNPHWEDFFIPMQKLCSGDRSRIIQFSVFDWNRSGNHELIGEASCSLQEIIANKTGHALPQLELIHPSKREKKGHKYRNSGILVFPLIQVDTTYSFMDYIKDGCKINLMVAIDFTSSNGRPVLPYSLHYIDPDDPGKDNDYVTSIKSVATILADYDSDQQFAAFGFGAKVPEFGGMSHCFPLNFNIDQPKVNGLEGILNAYRETLEKVKLHGPTQLYMILEKAMEYAKHPSQSDQHYQILLIITDGVVTDMKDTIDCIVKASSLPLSIVIVGVGNTDFTAMEKLDADDTPLVDRRGTTMARDIVQFVPFNKIKEQGISLEKEILFEIPDQFLSYMNQRNIRPNPPQENNQQP